MTMSPLRVLALAFVLGQSVICSIAELEKLDEAVKPDGSLSMLVIGDWGRRGGYNQSHVAAQMGIVGEKLEVDFLISTGDNFYDHGLYGVDDPAFFESFSNVYTAPSLQKQWYSVLGNHDYRGDAEAQLSPVLRELDRRWFCQRSYVVSTEIADFFFVDTTPFVDGYFDNPKWTNYDWRGVQPRDAYLSNLLKDLDSALTSSVGKWKVVVGHHPIKSAGHHGSTKELDEHLLPILLENDVDLYVNGHDHCLEHISDSKSPLQFLTSGGGSKAWRGDFSRSNPHEMKFYYDGQGFMSLEVRDTKLEAVFYNAFGSVLHKWSRIRQQFYVSN